MDTTTSQAHQNPNLEPHQNNSMYYDHIASYLMSDEDLDEGFEKNPFLMDKDDVVVPDDHNIVGGSSGSVDPGLHNMRRELKEYSDEHEDHRFAFRTKTDLEVMDDGYKWRKYGKKMMKNSPNPRNYFKCSHGGCTVKKRVERERDDPAYVITTYQGVHNHP